MRSSPVSFRQSKSLPERIQEAQRVRSRYPDRIPLIVEKAERCKLPLVDKRKYLCPGTMTMGEFMWVLRKRIRLDPAEALFLLTEQSTIPPTSSLLSDVYLKHASYDQFLYFKYSSENTFGGGAKEKSCVVIIK